MSLFSLGIMSGYRPLERSEPPLLAIMLFYNEGGVLQEIVQLSKGFCRNWCTFLRYVKYDRNWCVCSTTFCRQKYHSTPPNPDVFLWRSIIWPIVPTMLVSNLFDDGYEPAHPRFLIPSTRAVFSVVMKETQYTSEKAYYCIWRPLTGPFRCY